jgi:hypothetical protein
MILISSGGMCVCICVVLYSVIILKHGQNTTAYTTMSQIKNDDGTITLTVPVSPDMMRDYVPSLQFTATGPDGKPFALSQADCMRMVEGATWTHNGKVIAEYEGSKKRLRALLGKKKNARTKGAHKGGEELGRGF